MFEVRLMKLCEVLSFSFGLVFGSAILYKSPSLTGLDPVLWSFEGSNFASSVPKLETKLPPSQRRSDVIAFRSLLGKEGYRLKALANYHLVL